MINETTLENGDFDTEKFIKEIHSKPVLWDLTAEEYSNKDLKKKNWEELVNIFINKEDATAAEKNEFSRVLQRKWKSLRDCYSRERQRLAKIKSGSAVSRKTQYMFYNRLSFLQKVIKSKSTLSNMEEAAVDGINPDNEEASAILPRLLTEQRLVKKRKTDTMSSEIDHLVTVLEAGIQSQEERERAQEEDDDRLFLLSLLNPLKRIPEHLRLSVRVQMLQVIDNAAKY